MDVLEAIRSRRSCRRFSTRPVEDGKINLVLEAGAWAPSPGNSQPWEFGVVAGSNLRRKIRENADLALKYHLYEISGFRLTPLSYLQLHPLDAMGWGESKFPPDAATYDTSFLEQVPVIVAVAADPRQTPDGAEGRNDGYKYASAAAVQNMLLSAHFLGLGSLWFTLFHERTLKPVLGIVPEKHLIALVCLGYPEEQSKPPPRRSHEALVRRLG